MRTSDHRTHTVKKPLVEVLDLRGECLFFWFTHCDLILVFMLVFAWFVHDACLSIMHNLVLSMLVRPLPPRTLHMMFDCVLA